jgi:hypothetical protein
VQLTEVVANDIEVAGITIERPMHGLTVSVPLEPGFNERFVKPIDIDTLGLALRSLGPPRS